MPTLVGILLLSWLCGNVAANDDKGSELSKNDGLTIAGWLNAGFTFNPDRPENRFNGPLGFSDRANEFQLNQLYLYAKRDPVNNAGQWDWGGRLDFVFGSDAFYTRSMGDPSDHWDSHLMHDRIYGIAFPQAYLELFVPVGHGLRITLGEFYTLVGSETVTAPDNFYYSRSYIMQFAEPFSHTGLLFRFKPADNIKISAGAVTGSPFAGWDGSFQHYLGNWGFVGGIDVTLPHSGTAVTVTGTHGSLSANGDAAINLYSLVIQQQISERWQLTLQHDYGWLDRTDVNENAEWYGLLTNLTYDVNDRFSLGLRLEWFRDDDGTRVGVPARQPFEFGHAAHYYGATFGANWKPEPWITVRPSIRYDVSDGWTAFDDHSSNRQLLVSSDFILSF